MAPTSPEKTTVSSDAACPPAVPEGAGIPTDMVCMVGHEQAISGTVAVAASMVGDAPMRLEEGCNSVCSPDAIRIPCASQEQGFTGSDFAGSSQDLSHALSPCLDTEALERTAADRDTCTDMSVTHHGMLCPHDAAPCNANTTQCRNEHMCVADCAQADAQKAATSAPAQDMTVQAGDDFRDAGLTSTSPPCSDAPPNPTAVYSPPLGRSTPDEPFAEDIKVADSTPLVRKSAGGDSWFTVSHISDNETVECMDDVRQSAKFSSSTIEDHLSDGEAEVVQPCVSARSIFGPSVSLDSQGAALAHVMTTCPDSNDGQTDNTSIDAEQLREDKSHAMVPAPDPMAEYLETQAACVVDGSSSSPASEVHSDDHHTEDVIRGSAASLPLTVAFDALQASAKAPGSRCGTSGVWTGEGREHMEHTGRAGEVPFTHSDISRDACTSPSAASIVDDEDEVPESSETGVFDDEAGPSIVSKGHDDDISSPARALHTEEPDLCPVPELAVSSHDKPASSDTLQAVMLGNGGDEQGKVAHSPAVPYETACSPFTVYGIMRSAAEDPQEVSERVCDGTCSPPAASTVGAPLTNAAHLSDAGNSSPASEVLTESSVPGSLRSSDARMDSYPDLCCDSYRDSESCRSDLSDDNSPEDIQAQGQCTADQKLSSSNGSVSPEPPLAAPDSERLAAMEAVAPVDAGDSTVVMLGGANVQPCNVGASTLGSHESTAAVQLRQAGGIQHWMHPCLMAHQQTHMHN